MSPITAPTSDLARPSVMPLWAGCEQLAAKNAQAAQSAANLVKIPILFSDIKISFPNIMPSGTKLVLDKIDPK
jgi:hypothetical protein